MQDLLDPAVADEIKQRIQRLRAKSERQWGKLTVAGMLVHCTRGLQMATGELNLERAGFPAGMVGRLIKPLVVGGDRPMRRNVPSLPQLFAADAEPGDLERERIELVATIDRFVSAGAAGCSRHPHPLFGPLSPQQWATLMYKHLDHHLRQFGA